MDTYPLGTWFPVAVRCMVGCVCNCYLSVYLSTYIYIYIYLLTYFLHTYMLHIYIYIHISFLPFFPSRRQRVMAAAFPPNQFCTHAYTMPCELHMSQHAQSQQQPSLQISFAQVLHSCLHNALWAAHEPACTVTAAAFPPNQFCIHAYTMLCELHKSRPARSQQQPWLIIRACTHAKTVALWALPWWHNVPLAQEASIYKTYIYIYIYVWSRMLQHDGFTNNTVRQQVTCNVAKTQNVAQRTPLERLSSCQNFPIVVRIFR